MAQSETAPRRPVRAIALAAGLVAGWLWIERDGRGGSATPASAAVLP